MKCNSISLPLYWNQICCADSVHLNKRQVLAMFVWLLTVVERYFEAPKIELNIIRDELIGVSNDSINSLYYTQSFEIRLEFF